MTHEKETAPPPINECDTERVGAADDVNKKWFQQESVVIFAS